MSAGREWDIASAEWSHVPAAVQRQPWTDYSTSAVTIYLRRRVADLKEPTQ